MRGVHQFALAGDGENVAGDGGDDADFELPLAVVAGADDFHPGIDDGVIVAILQPGQFFFNLGFPFRKDFQVAALNEDIKWKHTQTSCFLQDNGFLTNNKTLVDGMSRFCGKKDRGVCGVGFL